MEVTLGVFNWLNCFKPTEATEPVSYTHLDVYKRQEKKRKPLNEILL